MQSIAAMRSDLTTKVSNATDLTLLAVKEASTANSPVPSPDPSLLHKLNSAKGVIQMLMKPFHAPESASATPSVRDRMKPYVECAKVMAGQVQLGFSVEELAEMFDEPR